MPPEEEIVAGEEEVVEPEVVEPEPEPEAPAGITPEERSTWEGRVRTEQARRDTANAQLAPMGLRIDPETGNVVPVVPQSGGYVTTAQPPAPEFDWDRYSNDPQAVIDERVTQGVQAGIAQMMNVVTPLMDRTAERQLKQDYPDWADIGDEVKSTLTNWGFQGIMQAEALADQQTKQGRRVSYVQDAVNAVRGARLYPKAQAAVTAGPTEEERQTRLAEGAQVGGSPTGTQSGDLGLTPDERAEATRLGVTPQQMAEALSGAVTVDVLGIKKKGGK